MKFYTFNIFFSLNLDFSKVLSITFISIVISLLYNHFNPDGLHLIREERKLNWEIDSLSTLMGSDSLLIDKSSTGTILSDSVVVEKKDNPIKSFKKPTAIKLDFAYKLYKDGIRFIDSRSVEEFSEGHIKGAVNIPFYGSENHIEVINRLNKNEIVVTYCSSEDCDISILSGDELFEKGFKRVYVYVGGYDEWTRNNYPTSK